MLLNSICISILNDLYKKHINPKWKPSIDNYGLIETLQTPKVQETMSYIYELEILGLVQFERTPCQQCDTIHPLFKNSCIAIWWEEIRITYKGIELLK